MLLTLSTTLCSLFCLVLPLERAPALPPLPQHSPQSVASYLGNITSTGYLFPERGLSKWLTGVYQDQAPYRHLLEELVSRKKEARKGQEVSRLQCIIPKDDEFPCSLLAPSLWVPSSVHKLRPGDIKVVAGLGDSLTAGMVGGSKSVLDMGTEYRSLAFSMGGQGDWRTVTSLPNILKLFNPTLRGASMSNTVVASGQTSGYNMAVSAGDSLDMVEQAWHLVKRMRRDPKMDFNRDWKMVTMFVGANDICRNLCNNTLGFLPREVYRDASPLQYRKNVQRSLDILHTHLPRTFVNLLLAPSSISESVLQMANKPPACYLTHPIVCPCLFDDHLTAGRISGQQAKEAGEGYSRQLEELVGSGRYDTRPDFTVVIQPVLAEGKIPRLYSAAFRRSLPDLSYFAPDCLHFSQKLHAMFGRALWNNLMQPVGHKSRNWVRNVPFFCPSSQSPYLATARQGQGESEVTSMMESMTRDWQLREGKQSLCPL